MRRRLLPVLGGLSLAIAGMGLAAPGKAAGFFYVERGVRPLGRGGAFVAGADDPGAISFNPAGLAAARQEILVDGSWLDFGSTFRRRSTLDQVDPNTGQPTGQTFTRDHPSVDGTTPVLPIPAIAYTHPIGRKTTLGIGVWAPYAAVSSYPTRVGGEPAPQRYSLVSMDGSALATFGLYGATEVAPGLRLGAGVEVLGGFFETRVAFSACVPERFVCAPEQPEYDAPAHVRAGPMFAPSGIFGVQVAVSRLTALGASFHLPYWVSAPATVDVGLPSAPVFATATTSGDEATVRFRLPWILRAGIEQTLGRTRVELTYVHEHWSMHDRIEVEPHGMSLNGVVGFPPSFPIAPVNLPRGFRDTNSVRAGVEHPIDLGGTRLDARGGVMLEQGAIPAEMLSVTTLDFDKLVVALGASIHATKRLRFDLVVAHVFTPEVTVHPLRARIAPVNPVSANPPALPHAINGGTYSASANVFGAGLRYVFGADETAK